MFSFFRKKHKPVHEVEEISKPFTIEEEAIYATLDHRTCVICGVLDGKVFKAGEGPYPPFHSQCRCVRLGWLGSKQERPFVDPVEKSRPKDGQSPFYDSVGKTPVDKRKIGTTKDSYAEWFDRQKNTKTGRKFQKVRLGPSRYEAYVAGNLSLDDMVNLDTLEMYTLEQLGLEPEQ